MLQVPARSIRNTCKSTCGAPFNWATPAVQVAAAEGLRVINHDAEAERGRRWGARNTFGGVGARDSPGDLLVRHMGAVLYQAGPTPARAETKNFYNLNDYLYCELIN